MSAFRSQWNSGAGGDAPSRRTPARRRSSRSATVAGSARARRTRTAFRGPIASRELLGGGSERRDPGEAGSDLPGLLLSDPGKPERHQDPRERRPPNGPEPFPERGRPSRGQPGAGGLRWHPEQRRLGQTEEVRRRTERQAGGPKRLEPLVGEEAHQDLAEGLDLHRPLPGEVGEPLDALGRAVPPPGAEVVRPFGPNRTGALRARLRHRPGCRLRPLGAGDDPGDLRDHIPGPPDPHPVARSHPEALDHPLVVERGAADRGPGERGPDRAAPPGSASRSARPGPRCRGGAFPPDRPGT